MLAQMVCIDRRYQRMNCFNVREVQSLLKQKFFLSLNDDLLWTTRISPTLSKMRNRRGMTVTDSTSLLPFFEDGNLLSHISKSVIQLSQFEKNSLEEPLHFLPFHLKPYLNQFTLSFSFEYLSGLSFLTPLHALSLPIATI